MKNLHETNMLEHLQKRTSTLKIESVEDLIFYLGLLKKLYQEITKSNIFSMICRRTAGLLEKYIRRTL